MYDGTVDKKFANGDYDIFFPCDGSLGRVHRENIFDKKKEKKKRTYSNMASNMANNMATKKAKRS